MLILLAKVWKTRSVSGISAKSQVNVPENLALNDRFQVRSKNNGSVLKNPEISGAIFTLNLSIQILNSQCVEGARDVRVL